ncbi:MAG: hypothetical protein IJV24_04315, partial [Prevotella sp.]|nr:hypothetical protein [Prevotella sp.]
VVELFSFRKEMFGHEFGTQRVARHDDGVGNLAVLGSDGWGGSVCQVVSFWCFLLFRYRVVA